MSLDQISIRPAELRDAVAVAEVHDRAWRGTYRGIIPGVALERMIERRGPAWWRRLIAQQRGVLVLEVGDTVVGYATMGINRSRTLRVRGEIYELYVAPEYQGLGFGAQLFRAARDRLRHARLGHFVVWVLEDNETAVAFYRAMGGEHVAHGIERFDGAGRALGKGIKHHQGRCRKLAFVWGADAQA